MNNENSDSSLEAAYRNSETVGLNDLARLEKEKPVKTIVCVKEEGNKPYLLASTNEDPENKMWVPYTGETYEQAQQFVKWTIEGEKLYKSKARSKEELDHLRKIILSYGNICDLVNNKDYAQSSMILIVDAIAKRWLIADHPDFKKKLEDKVKCDEMYVYSQLVVKYIDRFVSYLNSIKATQEAT